MKAFICFFLFLLAVCFASAQVFTIDASQKTIPFPHFWEECVGSGHALLGLRADWQRHITAVHQDLGFKQVRFHGVFDDDLSVILDKNGAPEFSWFNIDTVYDFLQSIDMRPYVELSFMPEFLASGPQTIFHYKGNITPPNNVTLWGEFLQNFALHLIDRYGWDEISQWSFEVWNEPNCGFFYGNQTQYFQLFKETFLALKSVNNAIRVGGPSTCISGWLPEFLSFCQQNKLAFDFIATHQYPTDISPPNRDILFEVFSKSRATVGPNTTLYYSEYNDGLYNPAFHDTPYASSFVFHTLHQVQGIVDLLSWWTFTDIFEEAGQTSQPYFGPLGWGLLNIYGVPKPVYRAFQILHNVGTQELPTVASSSNTTTGVYGIVSPVGASTYLDIIAYNFDLPNSAIQNETVTIQLTNLKNVPGYGYLTRIDDTNANAPAEWVAQGSPAYPTTAQIAAQIGASELTTSVLKAQQTTQTSAQFSIELPKWGSAHLRVQIK
jgi:xylan 1,4-beta-xylosidase